MRPKLAVCSHLVPSWEETVELARERGNGTSIDYSLDSADLDAVTRDVSALRAMCPNNGLEVRYHLPFGDAEIANSDPRLARGAVDVMKSAIDRVAEAGGLYATLHMGLNSDLHGPLNWEHAVEHLTELVGYGRGRGVIVCLENLREGFTSEPDRFMDLIHASGAAVTFDVGHATSSAAAAGGFDAARFARLVASRVANVHVYDREGPGHIAPTDLSRIGDALTGLLDSECRWWVVELGNADEVRRTRDLLIHFLESHES